jgi:catalase
MSVHTRNYGGDPNYVRSTLSPGIPSQVISDVRHTEPIERSAVLGKNEIAVDDEDYVQPRELWNRVFDESERRQWVENVSETLEAVPPELKQAVIAMFGKVDPSIRQLMAAKGKETSHL